MAMERNGKRQTTLAMKLTVKEVGIHVDTKPWMVTIRTAFLKMAMGKMHRVKKAFFQMP
jgi:hypothetical protein